MMNTATNIRSVIKQAFKIGTTQYEDEITGLAELAYTNQCKNILEIGSEHGGTFYIFCSLFPDEGQKISVDKYGIRLHNPTDDPMSWAENVHLLKMKSYYQPTVEKVEGILDGEQLDLLFIDGNHHYSAVKKDFKFYRHLVKKGGLIGFHDVNTPNSHNVQVKRFWEELITEEEFSEVITFINHDRFGIGVIRI